MKIQISLSLYINNLISSPSTAEVRHKILSFVCPIARIFFRVYYYYYYYYYY